MEAQREYLVLFLYIYRTSVECFNVAGLNEPVDYLQLCVFPSRKHKYFQTRQFRQVEVSVRVGLHHHPAKLQKGLHARPVFLC